MMSFLAFLIFGGIVGMLSAHLYPKKRLKLKELMVYALAGVVISFLVSFFGQTLSLFRSGQMLEWFSTLLITMLFVACWRALTGK
ncbi:MAG: hypothetical protein E6Q68_02680 [Polynucleobacter sp.]|nr:MAG: hypothetical protein E6Q68_02680 [Polynucleobacter sp.]